MTDKHRGRLLIVDDEPDILFFVGNFFKEDSYHVETRQSATEGLELLKQQKFDILISDIRMPGMDGISLIQEATSIQPALQCMVITGHGDIETAIEALKLGAVNYFRKPLNFEEMQLGVSRSMEKLHLTRKAREDAELFQAVINNSTTLIHIKDQQGQYLMANKMYEDLFFPKQESIIGKTDFDLFDDDTATSFRSTDLAVFSSNTPQKHEEKIRHRDKEHTYISIKFPIHSPPVSTQEPDVTATSPHAVCSISTDISDSKLAEELLLASEEKYRLISENSTDAICQLDLDGHIRFINKAGTLMLGYSKQELCKLKIASLVSENHTAKWTEFFDHILSGQSARREFTFLHRKGHEVPVAFSMGPLQKNNSIVGAIGTVRDITARKEEEEKQLRKSLAEKESLLKEIHHRVKNNMQIISSLLFLQAQKSTSQEVQDVLRDSRNRVKTMGLIHEKLYGTINLARIDFNEYINTLTSYLSQTYSNNHNPDIIFTIEATGIFLTLDTAIPCGLIINELVSNSYKHAFQSGATGEISISLARKAGGKLALDYSDNGSGLPGDFAIDKLTTLGISLVVNLANQLGATLDFPSDKGFRCIITIDLEIF